MHIDDCRKNKSNWSISEKYIISKACVTQYYTVILPIAKLILQLVLVSSLCVRLHFTSNRLVLNVHFVRNNTHTNYTEYKYLRLLAFCVRSQLISHLTKIVTVQIIGRTYYKILVSEKLRTVCVHRILLFSNPYY